MGSGTTQTVQLQSFFSFGSQVNILEMEDLQKFTIKLKIKNLGSVKVFWDNLIVCK